MKKHTIVLIQSNKSKQSRTYFDFPSVPDAMLGICTIFENKLKDDFPKMSEITYDVSDLHKYIDSLSDISCLVLDKDQYTPHGKEWIKKRVLLYLANQSK